MYAKKFFRPTKSLQNKKKLSEVENNIIEFVKYSGHKGVTINDLMKKFKVETFSIYEIINKMISIGIIHKVYASDCPVCGSENISKCEYELCQCEYCKENYIPNYTYEKFISVLYYNSSDTLMAVRGD